MEEQIKHFGQLYKAERNRQGYSRKEIAEMIDTCVPTIEAFENGKRDTGSGNLFRYSAVLDIVFLANGRIYKPEQQEEKESYKTAIEAGKLFAKLLKLVENNNINIWGESELNVNHGVSIYAQKIMNYFKDQAKKNIQDFRVGFRTVVK